MAASRRVCLALAFTLMAVFLLHNNSAASSRHEEVDTKAFSTSDHLSCRWLGLCGVSHIEAGSMPTIDQADKGHALYESEHGHHDPTIIAEWLDSSKHAQEADKLKAVPQYVLDHAPLVHLHSEELYWPSDMQEHLKHITPTVQYDVVDEEYRHPGLNDLLDLNKLDGERGWKLYLQSNDDVMDMPAWLTSEYGIPVFPDDDENKEDVTHGNMEPKRNYTVGGRSSGPAVLMVIDKGNGVVDAMWHFFYSYNLGNGVFGIRFGNHVGDWEHTVMRFHNGTPVEMFLSEHAGGVSYTYEAMEKDVTGIRVSRPRRSAALTSSLTSLLACYLLCRRHPRHVRQARPAPIHYPLWHPQGRNRQRPSVGPGLELLWLRLHH